MCIDSEITAGFSLTNDTRLPDPLIPFSDPYNNTHQVRHAFIQDENHIIIKNYDITIFWGVPQVGAPFSVPGLSSQPVWVDIFIPTNITGINYIFVLFESRCASLINFDYFLSGGQSYSGCITVTGSFASIILDISIEVGFKMALYYLVVNIPYSILIY